MVALDSGARAAWRRRVVVGFGLVLAALRPSPGEGQPVSVYSVDDGVRMEFEHTLNLPDSLVEPVWAHLTRTFDPVDPWVQRFGPEFATRFSDERFVDRYYDTHALPLLQAGSGLRHRLRMLPDDPDHRKHERELVQLKYRIPGKAANFRTEAKFNVRRYRRPNYRYDDHPLIGLIERSERPSFLMHMELLDIRPEHLHQKLELQQRRRRVYIYRGAEEFGTITLDEIRSRLWWRTESFVVVEFEANEKTYTEGDDETRRFMLHVMTAIMEDLRATIGETELDPRAKYARMYELFDERFVLLPLALRYGAPAEVLFGSFLLLLVPGYLVWRHAGRPAPPG